MAPYERFWVRDEISGEEYQWGQDNYVRLEPRRAVAHIINMPVMSAQARTELLHRR
nr:glycosidase [Mycolicibacter nonchromogenicus]